MRTFCETPHSTTHAVSSADSTIALSDSTIALINFIYDDNGYAPYIPSETYAPFPSWPILIIGMVLIWSRLVDIIKERGK